MSYFDQKNPKHQVEQLIPQRHQRGAKRETPGGTKIEKDKTSNSNRKDRPIYRDGVEFISFNKENHQYDEHCQRCGYEMRGIGTVGLGVYEHQYKVEYESKQEACKHKAHNKPFKVFPQIVNDLGAIIDGKRMSRVGILFLLIGFLKIKSYSEQGKKNK